MTETTHIVLLFHWYLLIYHCLLKNRSTYLHIGHNFKVTPNVKMRSIIKQTTSETMPLWFLCLKKNERKNKGGQNSFGNRLKILDY